MSSIVFSVSKVASGVRYEIDADKSRLDRPLIHEFLGKSHWAAGIPMSVVERSIEHSLAFGLYCADRQIGFARVVTDYATFAYLADVFVLESHRGQGMGSWLVRTILAHPDLQNLRRWLLGTRNAHGLYRRQGFSEPPAPFSFLEKIDPGAYAQPAIHQNRRTLAQPCASY